MSIEAGRPAFRKLLVGLLLFLAVAGMLPFLAIQAFWVDLEGDGGPALILPFVVMLQGAAAALLAWAVLRGRALLPLYTVWAIACLGVVATLLARPFGELAWNGFFFLAATCIAVVIGVGYWVTRAKG